MAHRYQPGVCKPPQPRNCCSRDWESESQLWMGATCFAEVFHEASVGGWGGFWGHDHHIWVVTELREYVDLNISLLHLHPSRSRRDGIAVPAIWWDDQAHWPPVIRYLPNSPINIGFDTVEETADLELFLERVAACFDTLRDLNVGDIKFGPLLSNTDGMNELHAQGHPWLTRAIIFQDRRIPFPAWIQEREVELYACWQQGKRAPSRLVHVPGLSKP